MTSMSTKYLSRTLRAIILLWVAFPIFYLVYAGFGLVINMNGIVRLALTPFFWFTSAISITAGIGISKVRWYGWYLFLFSNFLTSYLTAVSLANYSSSDLRFLLFVMTLLFQLALIFIVGREVRVPYFFPRIRWWESDPR